MTRLKGSYRWWGTTGFRRGLMDLKFRPGLRRLDSQTGEQSLAGFVSKFAGSHHAPQQRRHRGAAIQRDRIEGLAEKDLGIQADQINQRAWAHLVSEAALDCSVDIFGACQSRSHVR